MKKIQRKLNEGKVEYFLDVWLTTCKWTRLELFLTLHLYTDSNWMTDLHIKAKPTKPPGRKHGNIFSCFHLVVRFCIWHLRCKEQNWILITTLHQNESSWMSMIHVDFERWNIKWKKIFFKLFISKNPIHIIYKEYLQLNNKDTFIKIY